MKLKFLVAKGRSTGKEIPLRLGKFLIGRGTECHLRPSSDLVSRHHCLLLVNDHEIIVRDLGSTNGTYLNGDRVSSDVVVASGDLLQIGPLFFQFHRVTADIRLGVGVAPSERGVDSGNFSPGVVDGTSDELADVLPVIGDDETDTRRTWAEAASSQDTTIDGVSPRADDLQEASKETARDTLPKHL